MSPAVEKLKELEQRLVAATEADRELDGDICVALDGGGEIVWKQANYTMEMHPARKIARENYVGGIAYEHVPRYTASLDAVVALCERLFPEASRDSMSTIVDGKRHYLWKIAPTGLLWVDAPAPSDALALLLAIVRAVLAGKEK